MNTLQPLFVDIDGTLTKDPHRKWGEVIQHRIDTIKRMIAEGHPVVLWSGGGTIYAREFALKHGLAVLAAVGKPQALVDDNPHIRPKGRMPVIHPQEFFGT